MAQGSTRHHCYRPFWGEGNAPEPYSHEGPPFSGTAKDQQRVYGANVLPVRKTRTLLQLTWLALKDSLSETISQLWKVPQAIAAR